MIFRSRAQPDDLGPLQQHLPRHLIVDDPSRRGDDGALARREDLQERVALDQVGNYLAAPTAKWTRE